MHCFPSKLANYEQFINYSNFTLYTASLTKPFFSLQMFLKTKEKCKKRKRKKIETTNNCFVFYLIQCIHLAGLSNISAIFKYFILSLTQCEDVNIGNTCRSVQNTGSTTAAEGSTYKSLELTDAFNWITIFPRRNSVSSDQS